MNTAVQYIVAILGFSLIIIVHELGHFLIAKASKIHVEEFFIGMGPKILKFKSKSGTLWGLSAIPVGGYNKISGMTEDEPIPEGKEKQAYYKKPLFIRFFVIIAGSFMNIIFAFIMLIVFFSSGIYQPVNKVDFVEANSPASFYNIQIGDEILYVNEIKINGWEDFSENVKKFPKENVEFTINRNGEELKINAVLGEKEGQGYLGISPKAEKIFLKPKEVIKESSIFYGNITVTYFKLFKQLFTGEIPFSQARPVSPIGVVSIFQQSAAMGIQNFILLVSLVSLILGFSNLIPILPLDGGHVVVMLIEAVRRRKLSKKAIMIYNNIGIAIFVLLIITGLFFDIFKPINISNM